MVVLDRSNGNLHNMSSHHQSSFLAAVLGKDGLAALNKAIARQGDLAEVLVPRTILSFVGTVQDLSYKGEIPGLPGSLIALTKSGGIINTTSYTGADANRFTMAAHLAILLGVTSDSKLAKNTKNIDLTRLGKAIDLLVKSRLLRQAMEKTDLPGSTAKPTKQDGPQAATPPQKAPKTNTAIATNKKQKPTKKPPETQEKVPGLKPVPTVKIPEIKIGKSEAYNSQCKVCGQTQFNPKDGGFYGCICLRGLAPFTTLKMETDHYVIWFGPEWDEDAREVLFEMLHSLEG